MASWLGLWVFTAMDQLQSLVRELRHCKTCGTAKKKKDRESLETPTCVSGMDLKPQHPSHPTGKKSFFSTNGAQTDNHREQRSNPRHIQ